MARPTPSNREQELRLKIVEKAKTLLLEHDRPLWEPSPLATLQRDLRLSLEQIQTVQDLHEQLELSLTRSECRVGTEILQLERRAEGNPDLLSEREKHQGRLLAIEAERRRLTLSKHEQIRQLHDKLLAILNRYYHLTGNDENGYTSH